MLLAHQLDEYALQQLIRVKTKDYQKVENNSQSAGSVYESCTRSG